MTFVHFYCDPVTEFDRLFEDAFAARACPNACASLTEAKRRTPQHHDVYRPSLDLSESKDINTVTATFELPGLTPESVAVDVHQNRLTVSGESAVSHAEDENYVVRERHSGKFSRTLRLPIGTKPEDVKAKMENGVLTVTFPKTSPKQQAKRVTIE